VLREKKQGLGEEKLRELDFFQNKKRRKLGGRGSECCHPAIVFS